jgi:hypothetical protein
MFKSMGNVDFRHPAFVKNDGTNTPSPGDYFYIANAEADGHTGIFIEDLGDGQWRTAEGGGGAGDGTLCRFGTRTIHGSRFTNDGRKLHGWFDCTRVGLAA